MTDPPPVTDDGEEWYLAFCAIHGLVESGLEDERLAHAILDAHELELECFEARKRIVAESTLEQLKKEGAGLFSSREGSATTFPGP